MGYQMGKITSFIQSRRFVVNPENKDAVAAVDKIMAADRQGDSVVLMSWSEMEALSSKDVYELSPIPEIEARG